MVFINPVLRARLSNGLICGLFCLLAVIAAPAPAMAQQSGPAVSAAPVEEVETETLRREAQALSQGPVVIELFSSQACVFCPAADRFFADLLSQEHVIGVACHVEYFDVRVGSLAQSFCSERQAWYLEALNAGPHYTPQMVVQGRHDVVGHKMPEIIAALREASAAVPGRITVTPGAEAGRYKITLPPAAEDITGPFMLTVLMIDRPHDVLIAQGRNKGQKMRYLNIASAVRELGAWNGAAEEMEIEIAREGTQGGFVILAQSPETAELAAAGRYDYPQAPQAGVLMGPMPQVKTAE